METEETDWTCPRTYRHPRFVKDLAIQLWGLKCSREMSCVHAALLAGAVELGLSCVPDRRTLSQWAKDDDWSGEVARMMRSIAPDIVDGMVVDLIMAASEGMPWLRRVLSGQEPKPNTARVRAVLTALSMIGIPDIAHGQVRESMGLPPGNGVGDYALPQSTSMPTDMGSWKSGLAARLGHMDSQDSSDSA